MTITPHVAGKLEARTRRTVVVETVIYVFLTFCIMPMDLIIQKFKEFHR